MLDIVIPGYNDVGEFARRIDVAFRARQNRRMVLFEYPLAGATSFADVAFDASFETNLFAEIDVHLGLDQLPHVLPVERKNALDYDEPVRLQPFGFCFA